MDWLASNAANIIVTAVLIAVVTLIVRKMIRDRKDGKSSCGGNCGSCGLCSGAHLPDAKDLREK